MSDVTIIDAQPQITVQPSSNTVIIIEQIITNTVSQTTPSITITDAQPEVVINQISTIVVVNEDFAIAMAVALSGI